MTGRVRNILQVETATPERAVPAPGEGSAALQPGGDDESVRVHRWGRSLLGLAAVVAVVALLLLAYWRLMPPRVATVELEPREVVQRLVTTGRVAPVSRARLGATVGGRVAMVSVREGDRVRAGQVLVTLDEAELSAAVREARAGTAAAEAALARVTSVRLPTAAAALAEAQQELERADRDLERAANLLTAGALSQQELERAASAADAARARLAEAQATAAGLRQRGADRRQAEAEQERARQAYSAALARLASSRVTAPGNGVVLLRQVEPGDVVQPGRALLELALDGPTEVVALPDERTLAQLRVGQQALVSADAFPDSVFAATVTRIVPAIDPQQGTVEVRLTVPAPPAYLIPDMTVSVDLEVDRRARALTLPIEVVRAPLSDSAWVLVARDGRAVRVPVLLGVRDARFVELRSGVAEGDRVIAGAADRVHPGDRVRFAPSR